MVASAFGINHVSSIDENIIYDYIPVDLCIKSLIVAGFKDYTEKSQMLPIYNSSSVKQASMTSLNHAQLVHDTPPVKAVMHFGMTFTKCAFVFWMIKIIEGLIPALIMDGIAKLVGIKPKWVFGF